eukprot:3489308-Alexandrium_andersonii.AAC.1
MHAPPKSMLSSTPASAAAAIAATGTQKWSRAWGDEVGKALSGNHVCNGRVATCGNVSGRARSSCCKKVVKKHAG